jgi:uncharacterized membrane protein HdeD (DUF308 family)
MSNGESASARNRVFGALQTRWGWLLAFGIFSVALGMIGLGMAVFVTLASVMFYGIVLLIDGGVQFAQSFQAAGWKAKLWHVIISLLYLFGGIVVIRNPVLASSILTLILAGIITAVGLTRIIMGFQMRGTFGWVWIVIGGFLALILGILIFANWPASSLVVIGTFVSIELILNGWSAMAVAFAARNAAKIAAE